MSISLKDAERSLGRLIEANQGALGWHERLQKSRFVRTRNPLLKAATDTVVSPGGPTELLDLVPPPAPSPLDLVQRFEVAQGVRRVFVVTEHGADGAEVVPESEAKPYLAGGLDGHLVQLEAIPAIKKTSRDVLDDRPWLEATLRRMFETAILKAAWRAVVAAAQADTTIPTASSWRDGQEVVEQADHQPDAILLNPADWQTIETGLPDGIAPAAQVRPGLLLPLLGRLAVVSTPGEPQEQALVGDLRGLGVIMQPGVDFAWSESDEDNFTHNRITLRAEVMGAAVVCAPDRLCRVTLDTADFQEPAPYTRQIT